MGNNWKNCHLIEKYCHNLGLFNMVITKFSWNIRYFFFIAKALNEIAKVLCSVSGLKPISEIKVETFQILNNMGPINSRHGYKLSNNKELEKTNLTLFFPMFPFDPPENIRKPLVF